MKLTLRASEYIDNCFLIERAEHDGRTFLEPTDYGYAFRCSSRIGEGRENVDIEGTMQEMRLIAEAILAGEDASFKRVGVEVAGGGFILSSPRNSDLGVFVEQGDAMSLANEILSKNEEFS